MKKNRWLPWMIGSFVLGVLYFILRGRIHFDWSNCWYQVRHADPIHVAVGIALIYGCYILRSIRWSIFIRSQKHVGPFFLLGTQFIGFTAVALLGRLADLVRPYLVSRRTQLPLSSQIATYTVERMFDLAAMAIIFSSTLAFAPDRASLPHHEMLARAGRSGLLLSVVLAAFALFVRASGGVFAAAAGGILSKLSPRLGESIRLKILAFRDGLNAISSFYELLQVFGISLLMWGGIVLAYLEVLRSFVEEPKLATIPFSHIMLLMAASMVGSILQLPILGWFTQIAATAATMNRVLGIPAEPAVGAGALLLLVTFMSVIPMGLLYARIEHVSLRKVAEASENVEDSPPISPVESPDRVDAAQPAARM